MPGQLLRPGGIRARRDPHINRVVDLEHVPAVECRRFLYRHHRVAIRLDYRPYVVDLPPPGLGAGPRQDGNVANDHHDVFDEHRVRVSGIGGDDDNIGAESGQEAAVPGVLISSERKVDRLAVEIRQFAIT